MTQQCETRRSSPIKRLLAVTAVIAAIGGGSVGFAFFMKAREQDLPSRPLTLEEKREIEAELQAALAASSELRLKEMSVHMQRALVLALPSGDRVLLTDISAFRLGCHLSGSLYNLHRALLVLREMPTAPA